MKPKLACADFTFPLLSHDRALQLIAMLEVDGVDIGLFENRSHLWPSMEFENVQRSARQLKMKLDDLGLLPADIFLQMDADFAPFAINHPEDDRRRQARDWFLHTLEYAVECGSNHVTALPGIHFPEESYEDSLSRAVDELSWRVARAQEVEIVFGVEAHVGSIMSDPLAALRVIEQTPGLTLTLDYTHFTRLGMADASVEPLLTHASHFHIRGAKEGRLQTSFADNTIDYARVLTVLDTLAYAGWLGIEYVWIDWEHCNECDNLSETILFRDYILNLIN